jgi:hypothetical protein
MQTKQEQVGADSVRPQFPDPLIQAGPPELVQNPFCFDALAHGGSEEVFGGQAFACLARKHRIAT